VFGDTPAAIVALHRHLVIDGVVARCATSLIRLDFEVLSKTYMTLTELRYVVALAQERHFGRAAAKCFVTQPTLSLALAKLEDELGIQLFERNKTEVLITARGHAIVEQARRVLDEASKVMLIAKGSRDELVGPLKLGVIPTIGPYLLPELIPLLRQAAPSMPLDIEENFTGQLLPLLRDGDIDCAVVALPIAMASVRIIALYDECMSVVVPQGHPWQNRKAISRQELVGENVLLLGTGHCFRDQVIEACPGHQVPGSEGRAGSSLETIRNMVASGLGISVMPESALTKRATGELVISIPFVDPSPMRRIAIVCRESYGRQRAIETVAAAVKAITAPWCQVVADAPARTHVTV
jgi:LysR family transcriptional regulator, hydrogen peroxide-inducible genes activator